MSEEKKVSKAKEYALRLLGYRQRSISELKMRLEKKGFSSALIKKTIAYLREIDLLNDETFTRMWIRERMRTRPEGITLLRHQLKDKGISEVIIEKAIAECTRDYDERKVAKDLVASRRKRYKNVEPLKVKKRLYDYLRRRGFSYDTIIDAIDAIE